MAPAFYILLACAGQPDLDHRQHALRAEIRSLVSALEAAGRYDCCIQVPCSLCATRTAGCSCGEGLRNGDPVCEECALMWHQGQGAEDVDPQNVRSFLEAARGGTICGEPR